MEVGNETYLIFNPPFLLIIGVFAWSGVLLIFQSCNVPYREVLDLPNYQHLTAYDTFKLGSYMSISMVTCMGIHILLNHWECTLGAIIVSIIAYISPVMYVGYIWVCHRNSLITLSQTLWDVLIPKGVPSFREIFLTDLVTSVAKILSDMTSVILNLIYLLGGSESIFGYATSLTILFPLIVTCLPFGYRLIQSLLVGYSKSEPIQYLNAFKHASTILGILVSPNLDFLWLAMIIWNSILSFCWDILVDWDMRRTWTFWHVLPNFQSLIISDPRWFYLFVALDFLLRVSWAVRFLDRHLNDYRILLGLSIAEILRRFLWTVIRIDVQVQAIARLRPPIKQLEIVIKDSCIPPHPIDGQPNKVCSFPCQEIDGWQVDEEEEILKKVEQTEDMSLEDSQMLCNFLPLQREYLPEVAEEEEILKKVEQTEDMSLEDSQMLCNFLPLQREYLPVVAEEEEILKKVEQTEDMSLEDSQILCSFLPFLREYLPEVASEIQSDIYSYVNSSEGALHIVGDYVYESYAVKDEMNTAEEEDDDLDTYPLVEVSEDDDYYDGQQESEWDTSDSNAEDNPLNEYPDEVSSSEESGEDTEKEEDDEDEDEEEDEDEDGVTCVNGFRELDKFGKTKILHSSEDEYSYEDGDEEDTLSDDEEEDDYDEEHRCDELKLQQLFHPSEVAKIMEIHLPGLTEDSRTDKLIWTPHPNGDFSSKSFIRSLMDSSPSSSEVEVEYFPWKKFWSIKQIPPEIHIFMWRLLRNGIPVAKRINKHLREIDDECRLCANDIETTEHLFLFCQTTQAILFASPLGLRTGEQPEMIIHDYVKQWLTEGGDYGRLRMGACLWWAIWKNRNAVVFNSDNMKIHVILQEAMKWFNMENQDDTWKPPEGQKMKINFDGAAGPGGYACGAVARDCNARFQGCQNEILNHCTAVEAEGKGALLAVELARKKGLETSSWRETLIVINALKNTQYKPFWRLQNTINKIRDDLRYFNNVEFRYVKKNANNVAHLVAALAVTNHFSNEWLSSPPCITHILESEPSLSL